MTPIFAIFSSGLMRVASSIVPHVPRCVALTNNQIPVQARLTGGRKDYKIDKIPDGVLGQSYVVLSTSKSEVRDEDIVAGPAILEVLLLCYPPLCVSISLIITVRSIPRERFH